MFGLFKFTIILIGLLFLPSVQASVKVLKVNVACLKPSNADCEEFGDKSQNLIGIYPSNIELVKKMEYFLREREYNYFAYDYDEQGSTLTLQVDFRSILSKINFMLVNSTGNKDAITEENPPKYVHLKKIIPIKEDDYLRDSFLEKSISTIKKYIETKGYFGVQVEPKLYVDSQGNNILDFYITEGTPILLEEIEIQCSNIVAQKLLKTHLSKFIHVSFDEQLIKAELDSFKNKYYEKGHFFIKVDSKLIFKGKTVKLQINLDINDQYYFTFSNNQVFTPIEMIKELKREIAITNKMNAKMAQSILVKMYEKRGLYGTKIIVTLKKLGSNKNSKNTRHYHVSVIEGRKIKIDKLEFPYMEKKLTDLFYDTDNDLISSGYYDRKYVGEFKDKIKDLLSQSGYLYGKVDRPKVKITKKKASIHFPFELNGLTLIAGIDFHDIPQEFHEKIKSALVNKINQPLNAQKIEEDLDTVENILRESGHLFASVNRQLQANSLHILSFNWDYSKVRMHLSAKLGPLTKLNSVLIYGNIKTKNIIIEREIQINKNDILTPSILNDLKTRISSQGIFSQVKIQTVPVPTDPTLANILIFVKEKNSGLIELTPGIRQDLGPKLGLEIGHNNLMGMNRSVNVKGQLNHRFSNNSIDRYRNSIEPNRKSKYNSKIEFLGKLNFYEPYFLGQDVTNNITGSFTRKRYFPFDADIASLNLGLTKQWSDFFSTQMQYQLEFIDQYNNIKDSRNSTATLIQPEKNNFRVGSFNTTATLDFRDHSINPTKGFFFDLALEIATPSLLSSNSSSYQVNYQKWVNRNLFFIPLNSNKTILAFSVSMGVLQNYSELKPKSSIPISKLFRLNGVDVVRGFKEEEINIPSGYSIDVNSVRVYNSLYFTNIKAEFRYFLTKDLAIVPFIDAGRLYVGRFLDRPMRSSVGVGFRYVTPVGPLEIDFGIKLPRLRAASGDLESPSQIHFSIGLF